jgi:hypothetical protein
MTIDTIHADATSQLHALGRNGYLRVKGLEVCVDGGLVTLRPITSRNVPGRCSIELDKSMAANLIPLLQRAVAM